MAWRQLRRLVCRQEIHGTNGLGRVPVLRVVHNADNLIGRSDGGIPVAKVCTERLLPVQEPLHECLIDDRDITAGTVADAKKKPSLPQPRSNRRAIHGADPFPNSCYFRREPSGSLALYS